MEWTRTTPTKPGTYWNRRNRDKQHAQVFEYELIDLVRVRERNGAEYLVAKRKNWKHTQPVGRIGGEWWSKRVDTEAEIPREPLRHCCESAIELLQACDRYGPNVEHVKLSEARMLRIIEMLRAAM